MRQLMILILSVLVIGFTHSQISLAKEGPGGNPAPKAAGRAAQARIPNQDPKITGARDQTPRGNMDPRSEHAQDQKLERRHNAREHAALQPGEARKSLD